MTTSSIDEAYSAIERAYGQGQFEAALEMALALQSRLDDAGMGKAGMDNPLPLRLELLLGHIHFYGLGNATAAQKHYDTVVRIDPESSLAQLARSSLLQSQNDPPAASSPEAISDPGDIPAVPWLNHLQDSQQALEALQQAWATVVLEEPAVLETPRDQAPEPAATPWASMASSEAEAPPLAPEPTPQREPQPEHKPGPALAPAARPDFAQGSLLVSLKPTSSVPTAQQKACPQQGQASWPQRLGKALSWRRNGGGGSGH
ncbi:MAG: hypothetical protein FJ053_07685 [Cyanobacteria bacterium M_surface_10_m1_298]|nr:hypothetical protein [Cyanobacteria bacterium M_surface_10_m1_298]